METLYSIEQSIKDRKNEIAAEAASRQTLKQVKAARFRRSGFFRRALDRIGLILISAGQYLRETAPTPEVEYSNENGLLTDVTHLK